MALAQPLIAWGVAEAIAAAPWTNIGTPVATPGQADPFGGTDAVLVDDNDAAASEARRRQIGFLPTNAATLFPCARANTAGASSFSVREVGGGNPVAAEIRWTWSGGVPTVAKVAGAATGVVLPPIALGGGWYGCLVFLTNLTPGAGWELWCYGSTPGGVAVGATYWYLRNCVLLDFVDDAKGWDEPPPGAKQVRAPSGLTDRWIPNGRRDYRFRGRARGIPSAPRGFPSIVSGWDGLNESIGVNAGVRAMLRAGQEGNDLLWVPDRSLCSQYITSELVEPFEGETYEHDNTAGDRAFTLELRNAVTSYPVYL